MIKGKHHPCICFMSKNQTLLSPKTVELFILVTNQLESNRKLKQLLSSKI